MLQADDTPSFVASLFLAPIDSSAISGSLQNSICVDREGSTPFFRNVHCYICDTVLCFLCKM